MGGSLVHARDGCIVAACMKWLDYGVLETILLGWDPCILGGGCSAQVAAYSGFTVLDIMLDLTMLCGL